MIRIREVVVVEGRYDRNTLLQAVDCAVMETNGFSIFNDRKKLALLRRLADTRGLILLTDSDGAGFVIRNRLKSILGPGLKHAYIPDVAGKEKRKAIPSKEGKLGVEGMTPEILEKALLDAGATVLNADDRCVPRQAAGISKGDFYDLGLSGRPDSSARRAALLKALDLPAHMSANALLEAVNLLMTKQELADAVARLPNSGDDIG